MGLPVLTRGKRGFMRDALTFEIMVYVPAQFRFRPVKMMEKAHGTRHLSAFAVFQMPKPKAAQIPMTKGAQKGAPCADVVEGAADEGHAVFGQVIVHRRQIAFQGGTQDQPLCLDAGDVNHKTASGPGWR